MTFSVLLLGLGQIGMSYDFESDPDTLVLTHARAFHEHPEFALAGGVDIDSGKRERFSARYCAPSFSDIDSALKALQPDIVVIATPTASHREIVENVLSRHRPSAILCEKPLAYELEDAEAIVAACSAKGCALYVNYMRNSEPGALEVKQRLLDGRIKTPVKGVVWYSKGFLHNGSHLFNLLEFWLGAFKKAKVLDAGRLLDDQDSEPDVQVEFERGKIVFLACWEEAFSHCTIELLSPSGRLRYENGGGVIAWQPTHAAPRISGYKVLQAEPEIIANGMDRYQYHVADQLANAIAGRKHALCTGREALATIEAMHKIVHQRS